MNKVVNLETEVSETLAAFFSELVDYNSLESLKDCDIVTKSTLDAAMQFANDTIYDEQSTNAFQSGIKLSTSIVSSL